MNTKKTAQSKKSDKKNAVKLKRATKAEVKKSTKKTINRYLSVLKRLAKR